MAPSTGGAAPPESRDDGGGEYDDARAATEGHDGPPGDHATAPVHHAHRAAGGHFRAAALTGAGDGSGGHGDARRGAEGDVPHLFLRDLRAGRPRAF